MSCSVCTLIPPYHTVGEFLEDAIVTAAVGLGEVALCRSSPEPVMVGFLTMRLGGQNHILRLSRLDSWPNISTANWFQQVKCIT